MRRSYRIAFGAIGLAGVTLVASCASSTGAGTTARLDATTQVTAEAGTSTTPTTASPPSTTSTSTAPASTAPSAAPTTGATAATAAPTTAAAPRPSDDLVRDVALDATEVAAGATLKLYEAGDQVEGQVTLDVCSQRFPSEALRTNRYQQAVVSPDGTFLASNENVLYRTVAGAAQAMDEIRAAVTNCPDGFVRPVLAGQSALRFTFRELTEAEIGVLARDHVALAVHTEDRAGRASDSFAVYQRRGRVLIGIYGGDLATVGQYAAVATGHLARLRALDAGE